MYTFRRRKIRSLTPAGNCVLDLRTNVRTLLDIWFHIPTILIQLPLERDIMSPLHTSQWYKTFSSCSCSEETLKMGEWGKYHAALYHTLIYVGPAYKRYRCLNYEFVIFRKNKKSGMEWLSRIRRPHLSTCWTNGVQSLLTGAGTSCVSKQTQGSCFINIVKQIRGTDD